MHISAKEIDQYRKRLLSMKIALQDNVEHLEESAHEIAASGVSFNHLAETGAETFEEDMSLEQLQNEENILYEINEALNRISQKSYGTCATCDKKIPKERLNALPFVRLCVPCQEQEELEAGTKAGTKESDQ